MEQIIIQQKIFLILNGADEANIVQVHGEDGKLLDNLDFNGGYEGRIYCDLLKEGEVVASASVYIKITKPPTPPTPPSI